MELGLSSCAAIFGASDHLSVPPRFKEQVSEILRFTQDEASEHLKKLTDAPQSQLKTSAT